MSKIYKSEIYSMTKEQNYMRGYKDGKSDILDKIRTEIEEQKQERCFDDEYDMLVYRTGLDDALCIIDKYMTNHEDKDKEPGTDEEKDI